MGRNLKNNKGLDLTEFELEIMNIVWDHEKVTVREVCDKLNQSKKLAYTTVATVFKVLENKKFLTSVKLLNTLFFSAKVSKTKYQQWYLNHKIGKVFDSPQALVSKFIEDTNLSQKEIDKIRAALEDLEF
jgi:predicted transcriptional regulator